jgi:hypothetical protein
MLPIFVFIALPTLSIALCLAILFRRFMESALRARSYGDSRRAMSRMEALHLLGLNPGANTRAIRAAYKRLILECHPDHGGSHQTAACLNLARDILLRSGKSRAA